MAPRAGRGRSAEKTLASILGIRLEQLAAEHDDLNVFLRKVGVSPGTYYLLVRGDANPTFDTLELIAKGLGLSIWELIGLNDGVVTKALADHDIDLDALTSASRARTRALAKIDSQRLENKARAVKTASGPGPKPTPRGGRRKSSA